MLTFPPYSSPSCFGPATAMGTLVQIGIGVDAGRGSLLLFTQALNHAFLLKQHTAAASNQHKLLCFTPLWKALILNAHF